jgi:hypothetical protein
MGGGEQGEQRERGKVGEYIRIGVSIPKHFPAAQGASKIDPLFPFFR